MPSKPRTGPIPQEGGQPLGLYLLVAVTFGWWFLQFFTGLFEYWPALGLAGAACVAVLGAAVTIQALREPHLAWKGLGLLAGLGAAFAGMWALQTKLSYGASLQSHPRYTAPHFAAPRHPGARVVRLACSDGVPVDGLFFPGNHAGAIVIYPGWVGGKDNFSAASLASWLAPAFQVLVLDPRGIGGSGGFQRGVGDGRLDIQAAAGFLRQKGASSVGVLAEGDVALAAALAAAEADPPADRRLDAVMLVGPTQSWGDAGPEATQKWHDDPRTSFGRAYWRVAAGKRLARGQGPLLAEVLPRVAPRPLLIVAHPGEAAKQAQKLYLAAAEPRGLQILPGSGWPVGWESYPAYYSATRDWFRRVLAAPKAAAPAALPGATPAAEAAMTPEQKVMREIMAEPQPLVPPLPTPAGRPAAGAAEGNPRVPILPAPPATPAALVPRIPALPAPPGPPAIRR